MTGRICSRMKQRERRLISLCGLCGLLAVLLTTLLRPGLAAADCNNGVFNEALPVTTISPEDSASFVKSPTAGVNLALVSPVHGMSLYVRVSAQNVLGQTHTLSDLSEVDDLMLVQSTDGVYIGASNAGPTWWTNTPGRYYWQVFGTSSPSVNPITGTSSCDAYAGRVQTINIVAHTEIGAGQPAAAPRMTLQSARSHGVAMVRARTSRPARIKLSCSRVNAATVHCALAWISSGYTYMATGTFANDIPPGSAHWSYDFHGTRSSVSCRAKHGRAARCRLRFHWRKARIAGPGQVIGRS